MKMVQLSMILLAISALIYGQDKLIEKIQRLPEELKIKIYWLSLERIKQKNREKLRDYCMHSVIPNEYGDSWPVTRIYCFRNLASECIEFIFYHPKIPAWMYRPIRCSEKPGISWGRSFGIILLHTCTKDTVQTKDLCTKIHKDQKYGCKGDLKIVRKKETITINLEEMFCSFKKNGYLIPLIPMKNYVQLKKEATCILL